MENRVGVVIIDYNSQERTVKYVNDLVSYSDVNIESIVIVDNSPGTKNTQQLISAMNLVNDQYEFDDVLCNKYSIGAMFSGTIKTTSIHVVKSLDNLGFAKGNNLGYLVLKLLEDINYVLFSNNDIQFVNQKIEISKLISDIHNNENVGMVGPNVIGLDGKKQSPCKYITMFERIWKNYYFGILPFFNCFYVSDLISNAKSDYVYRVIGAFVLMESKVFSEVGMFDEGTFLYAEEMIMSERLLKNGYKVYYDCDVQLIHEEGYSTGKKAKTNISNKVAMRRNIIQSNIYYYSKYKNTSKIFTGITTVACNVHCSLLYLKYLVKMGGVD
ncbi:MAG: glycosyltransferase family 2 protein [Lachnospiraceae bacterium]|nr:glycosyltransferase family 2 protein [Lachnospiraceae bacterium]